MFNDDVEQPRVLVVDDDVFMRGMLHNLLETQGYQVIQAEDGLKALSVFRQQTPDLVLLDAAMPVMDGFTACAELKKIEVSFDVPVIMITALDDEESVDKAFSAGAVEYITKPVHWAVLRHRVKVILDARQAQAAMRKSEARFRGLFEQAAVGIGLVDMQGRCFQANPGLQQILGRDIGDLLDRPFDKLFYPSDSVVEKEFHHKLLTQQISHYQMEKYFFRKESAIAWGRLTTSLVKNEADQPVFYVQMVEDITERKRAQTKQRLAAKVFETTSDGIMITNAEGRIIDVNQAFLLMTGYSYEAVLDQNPRFLQSGHHDRAFFDNLWMQVRNTGRWRGQIWNRRQNGDIFSVWLSISAVRGEHNQVTHYVAVYSDISSLKENDERMRLLSHYDPLTELPNRLLFHELLTRACRQEERVALLYLDIDGFKRINDLFNYDVGDACLKEVATRLRRCLREGDQVARLDSDEFAIVMSPIHQKYDTRVITDQIFAELQKPITVEQHTFTIDCNIGVSFFPSDSIQADQPDGVEVFIQQADMAMFMAKENGKNTCYVFTELS
ncbi:PAS domain S-box protein [Thioflexithrix psekupsensis]|uniref:Diguanylate cyclase n=1 Tax=Thioflexithrix psekupsensis TaxID=1570016 RepID=A0A251X6M4_9GAMM|nr:PAS domain S-box protein [Thioflexithrix psekupsensis]OUD13288.1 hypothetical protein TPSD3_11705 [Thioflexithrix psekupsensis]